MEYKIDGFACSTEFLVDVILRVLEYDRGQADIPRLIYSVDISKSSGNSKQITYFLQFFIRISYLLRLGVQFRTVDIRIVYTVFFTTCDAQFDFDGHLQLGKFLEIRHGSFYVFFDRFF